MKSLLTPHLILVTALAGWLNREQQKVIENLQEENRVPQELLGQRRPLLSDDQRCRLAAKGQEIGRRLLGEFATIVTPDTTLRWPRKLIAQKWSNDACGGRPGLMKEITELCVRMANENPSWGYRRIQGALSNLGHTVAHNTVKRALHDHGIEPAPERSKSTTWAQFLRTHWSTMATSDFFSTEVWTSKGLVAIYTFFVIRLDTLRVHIIGSTPNPNELFMKQAALDLVGFDDGFLCDDSHQTIDRDAKYTARSASC